MTTKIKGIAVEIGPQRKRHKIPAVRVQTTAVKKHDRRPLSTPIQIVQSKPIKHHVVSVGPHKSADCNSRQLTRESVLVVLCFEVDRHQKTAIGLTAEPVPPRSLRGAIVSKNDHC